MQSQPIAVRCVSFIAREAGAEFSQLIVAAGPRSISYNNPPFLDIFYPYIFHFLKSDRDLHRVPQPERSPRDLTFDSSLTARCPWAWDAIPDQLLAIQLVSKGHINLIWVPVFVSVS